LYVSMASSGKDDDGREEEEKEKDDDDDAEEEEEEKIPACHMFDFSQEDAACPDIYSDDDDDDAGGDGGGGGKNNDGERVDDALRQKYMDILSELNKGIGKETSTGEVKDDAEGDVEEEEEEKEEEEENKEIDDALLSQPRYPNVIRIFCREFWNSSKGMYYRKFNACSVSAAWKVHLENDPAKLHWYEVIREDFPCHLYFDLEFPKDTEGLNKDVDGDAYVDVLLGHVRKTLR